MDWTDEMQDWERISMVVEMLDSPATVEEIASKANVEIKTAEAELDRLRYHGLAVRDEKEYDYNHAHTYIDIISGLVRAASRNELKELRDTIEAKLDKSNNTLEAEEEALSYLNDALSIYESLESLESLSGKRHGDRLRYYRQLAQDES